MTTLDFRLEQQALGMPYDLFLCELCGYSKHTNEASKLVFSISEDKNSTAYLCRECSKKVLLKINSVFLGFEDDI